MATAPDLRIKQQENFDLFCMDCSTSWCNHIQHMIRQHIDAKLLWHGIEESLATSKHLGGLIEQHIQLPIFPSHDMFANVVIRPKSDGVYQLRLNRSAVDPSCYIEDPIGTTGPGEGRQAWRLMIIDFWRAELEKTPAKCQSKGHSVRAQSAWLAAMEQPDTSAELHSNLWCAWYHRLCLYCYQIKQKTIFGPDPDLVPDDEPAAKFSGLRGPSFIAKPKSGRY